MIDTILFDLDGTLLPMDNEIFTKGYFKGLAAKLAPLGYEPKHLVNCVWSGTAAMVKNDGTRLNAERFWETFAAMNPDIWDPAHENLTDSFYTNEFHAAKQYTGENPLAKELVDTLKKEGYRVVLATNPLFPKVGIEARLSWIGLTCSDFDLVTTYENMHYCKPNPKYYGEILGMIGKTPAECLMVGNNTDEDCAAAKAAGLETVLVTDCLINESCTPVATYTNTVFSELHEVICRKIKECT